MDVFPIDIKAKQLDFNSLYKPSRSHCFSLGAMANMHMPIYSVLQM